MKSDALISTIDTHTAGGPTRIVTAGLPLLSGGTAAERMLDFQTNHDFLRKLLLNEPRGHKDMYSAVIGPSHDPKADLSVFFMTTQGYLSTCVHSSMGVAAALLADASLQLRPDGNVYFDTPGGLVCLTPVYNENRLAEIRLRTKAGFIYDPKGKVDLDGKSIHAPIVFCGVFFLLIDTNQFGRPARREHLPFFVEMGKTLLEKANRQVSVLHPKIPTAKSISLALFYDQRTERGFRDIVIGQAGGVDRSPCGAGSGALAVYQHATGNLQEGEALMVEGVIGTSFQVRIVGAENVDTYSGCIPEVSGNAWITGYHQFILDESDPLREGFTL